MWCRKGCCCHYQINGNKASLLLAQLSVLALSLKLFFLVVGSKQWAKSAACRESLAYGAFWWAVPELEKKKSFERSTTQRFSRQIPLWAAGCHIRFVYFSSVWVFLCLFFFASQDVLRAGRPVPITSRKSHQNKSLAKWAHLVFRLQIWCHHVARRRHFQQRCFVSFQHGAENIACAPTRRKTQLLWAAKPWQQVKKKHQLPTADGALAPVAPPPQPDAPFWIPLMLLRGDFLPFRCHTSPFELLLIFFSVSLFFYVFLHVCVLLAGAVTSAHSLTGSLPAGPT